MRTHIFIDAENVPANNALETYEILREENDACECDVVSKESVLSQAYLKFVGKDFRIHNCDFGKNSADLYLTVIIAKAIYEEPDTDIIAIVSNDRDFAPIIRLAVEKHKQVLLLGLQVQSQAMADSLERMNVDKNFVTLGIIDGAMTGESISVEELPNGLFEYYHKHFKGSTIFAKRGDKLVEVPFIEGMHANVFIDLMRRCGIWSKSQNLKEGLEELYLRSENNRVRFVEPGDEYGLEQAMIEQMPSALKKYYRENYNGGTIFVSCLDGRKLELPFIDGMHLSRFIPLMRHFEVWSKSKKLKDSASSMKGLGLKLKGDYVFRVR